MNFNMIDDFDMLQDIDIDFNNSEPIDINGILQNEILNNSNDTYLSDIKYLEGVEDFNERSKLINEKYEKEKKYISYEEIKDKIQDSEDYNNAIYNMEIYKKFTDEDKEKVKDELFDLAMKENETKLLSCHDIIITDVHDQLFQVEQSLLETQDIVYDFSSSETRDPWSTVIHTIYLYGVENVGDDALYIGDQMCYYINCKTIPNDHDNDNVIKCSICNTISCHDHIKFCILCNFKICKMCSIVKCDDSVKKEKSKNISPICKICYNIMNNHYKEPLKKLHKFNFCYVCQKIKKMKMIEFDLILFSYKQTGVTKHLCNSCESVMFKDDKQITKSTNGEKILITKSEINKFITNYIVHYTSITKPIYTNMYYGIFPKDIANLILTYFQYFR